MSIDLAWVFHNLLVGIGENVQRGGLIETPHRMAEAWKFWTSGYDADPVSMIKTFVDGAEGHDDLVFQGGIPFYSHCEHHLAPFFGVVHIGYLPNGKVIGLSKFARIVDVYAHRLQTQERITNQIAALLTGELSQNVGVVVRARHLCIESRGVQKPGTITHTASLHGVFKNDPAARMEFLSYVQRADEASRGL